MPPGPPRRSKSPKKEPPPAQSLATGLYCIWYWLRSTVIQDRKIELQHDQTFHIEPEIKTSSQDVLFDFIANSVAKFIKDKNVTEKLPVGFTFSFPVKQESLNSGELICWVKGYNASGAKGKDVVQLLKDAFNRRRVSIQ